MKHNRIAPQNVHSFPDAVVHRFFSKVKISDNCWLWLAGKNKDGYGQFEIDYVTWIAHRVSWIIHFGAIPQNKPCVLHNCPSGDTPACVRPEHLWVGTNVENVADMDKKGRRADMRGECHSQSILNEDGVRVIRARHKAASNKSAVRKALSLEFGLTEGSIENIFYNRRWKHVA